MREVCEQYVPGFPGERCLIPARVLSIVLSFTELSGTFNGKGHAWAFDEDRNLYIDLSADQFSKHYPKVFVTKVPCSMYVVDGAKTLLCKQRPLPYLDTVMKALDHPMV